MRIRPFTNEEDLAIFRFQADKDKAGKWAELAKSLPERTVGQVKERWNWKQSAPSANAGSSPRMSEAGTTPEMATVISGEKTEPSKSEVTQRKVNHDSRLVGGEAKTSHFAGFTTVNPASVYI